MQIETPTDEPFALRARHVFPVARDPIADGVVTIDGDRIVALGENRSRQSPIDLGDVAILPGLVNAHTHLEFSNLQAPLGHPGMPLPDWIATVIQYRRQFGSDKWKSEHCDAAAQGLAESLACGVTALGNIVSPIDGVFVESWEDTRVDVTQFHEVIGLATDHIDQWTRQVENWARGVAGTSWLERPGLSPHAPYTVSPRLLSRLCRLSTQFRLPVAMHLAESAEELELLASHSGPFLELLTELGAWDAAAIPRGIPVLAYLEQLAQAHRALVVHGNLLDSDEIQFLAAHADTMSVVYCPRTHEFFRHGKYPLAEMLQAGVRVALGTDSRASSPDLSLYEEMRFAARVHPEVPPAHVLEMGTIAGARALGLARSSGSLEIGKSADLTVVSTAKSGPLDLPELLLDSSNVVATMIRGRFVSPSAAE